ncbi:GntR family transcriptional regulator [Leifsonia sp. fls2-241-R2A-40a]|uniref:GntR family transcriptional regulator n=1 Tax=Leifsonia sp. fls2-241-R2A-40a TaxID=3040290 RepID=UPI00254D3CA4|nr:GntR family transcriptional regulator [Leifsonia sp. fls2-241-R2A-40a]
MQTEHPLPREFFTDLDKTSPVPLYHQLSVLLERAIQDEVLPAGARLENEIALAQRLSLSRPTVRRAIQGLVDKGLLIRRRGVGTQVVRGPVTRNVELTSLYQDLSESGRTPSTSVIRHEVRPASAEEAEQLNIEAESAVLHVVRVRFADGVPLAILDNTLPTEFSTISADDLEARGLYELLRDRGVNVRIAHQRIGAREATAREGELLELAKSAAVLTMTRTAFDTSGRAVEYGQHCYRPDLYSFEITLVDR